MEVIAEIVRHWVRYRNNCSSPRAEPALGDVDASPTLATTAARRDVLAFECGSKSLALHHSAEPRGGKWSSAIGHPRLTLPNNQDPGRQSDLSRLKTVRRPINLSFFAVGRASPGMR